MSSDTAPLRKGPSGPKATDISGDHKIKVSITDALAQFLADKLVAGANIHLQILNPGGDEQIQISATVPTPLCTTNDLTITGLYACAENDSNTASGHASFAVGFGTTASGDSAMSAGSGSVASGDGSLAGGLRGTASGRFSVALGSDTFARGDTSSAENAGCEAGADVDTFTIPAGGTLVTIPGDVTTHFPFGNSGGDVAITPVSPAPGPLTTIHATTCPVFDGVNTTFSLAHSIDGVTTGGTIQSSTNGTLGGAISKSIGNSSQAFGFGSFASGYIGQAFGTNSFAHGGGGIGQFARYVVTTLATGGFSDATLTPYPLYAKRLYALQVTFTTVDALGGSRTYFVRNCLISTDASRTPTLLTDAATLSQDPDGSGITTDVVVAQGEVGFKFTFPAPLVNNVNCAVTAEWTEVSIP